MANWMNQYELPIIDEVELRDFQRNDVPMKFRLAGTVLNRAASLGLPMSRFEYDFEDGFLNLTWREREFDLFVHTSDDGDVFGYFRKRMSMGREIDSRGRDLNSLTEVLICLEVISVSLLPSRGEAIPSRGVQTTQDFSLPLAV